MSEPGPEAHSDEPAAAPLPPAAGPDRAGARPWPLGFAVLVIAVAGVVGAGLGYAVDTLLPWHGPPAVTHSEFAALATRVTALENRLGAMDRITATQKAVQQRLDRLEAAEKQVEQSAAGSQQLASRLDSVEKQAEQAATTSRQLADRLEAAEKEAAAADAATAKAVPELARLGTAAADLERRLAALEKQLKSQAATSESATPLLLALLQIRAAIAAERPFPTEYAALQGLAKGRPDLNAAMAPLAAAAPAGVPSRTALRQGLDQLADKLAAAPAADQGWQAQALARLRGLVTIRRVDSGAGGREPQAAVAAARRSLDAGDLAGAVAAVQQLSGADAAAAQPWLRQARQRLAVEAALARLQQLATPPAKSPS